MFIYSEVMNKGEILALVQMSNCSSTEDEIKKEKVKPALIF